MKKTPLYFVRVIYKIKIKQYCIIEIIFLYSEHLIII